MEKGARDKLVEEWRTILRKAYFNNTKVFTNSTNIAEQIVSAIEQAEQRGYDLKIWIPKVNEDIVDAVKALKEAEKEGFEKGLCITKDIFEMLTEKDMERIRKGLEKKYPHIKINTLFKGEKDENTSMRIQRT